jgi:creatinine amidohydrolase
MLVVTASYGAFGLPPGLFPEEELRHGIHGGSVETSIMLHLRPDLVREGERRNFVSASVALAERFTLLGPEGEGIGFGWQIGDLNPQGACGNALDADAERGRRIVEHWSGRFIELLREVDRFSLNTSRP